MIRLPNAPRARSTSRTVKAILSRAPCFPNEIFRQVVSFNKKSLEWELEQVRNSGRLTSEEKKKRKKTLTKKSKLRPPTYQSIKQLIRVLAKMKLIRLQEIERVNGKYPRRWYELIQENVEDARWFSPIRSYYEVKKNLEKST